MTYDNCIEPDEYFDCLDKLHYSRLGIPKINIGMITEEDNDDKMERTITLENGKKVILSEESYNELAKATQSNKKTERLDLDYPELKWDECGETEDYLIESGAVVDSNNRYTYYLKHYSDMNPTMYRVEKGN